VRCEDGIVDNGGEREVIKEISEVLPDFGSAVDAEALVIEAIHLSDLTALVVAYRSDHQ